MKITDQDLFFTDICCKLFSNLCAVDIRGRIGAPRAGAAPPAAAAAQPRVGGAAGAVHIAAPPSTLQASQHHCRTGHHSNRLHAQVSPVYIVGDWRIFGYHTTIRLSDSLSRQLYLLLAINIDRQFPRMSLQAARFRTVAGQFPEFLSDYLSGPCNPFLSNVSN